MRAPALVLLLPVLLCGCGSLQRLSEVGRPPSMTPSGDPTQEPTYRPMTMPMPAPQVAVPQANALWRSGSRAFFKDQRAALVGDIVTVLVNITDNADLKNNTAANRNSSEGMGVPNLFGLETTIPRVFAGAVASNLVTASSNNGNTGTAELKRNETVALRLAGVITQVLPNGNLVVAARQEVRVNSELRDLQVTGVIRPQDIASDNTVRHDRMAEARIAYGGRGQLTDVQTPRWGQQVMDILLPF
ncbi:flagellar basal body L-ring protein FlgH [Limobrevibacterium gyesilva]|uniref:Flagellar L-ring protein n=1 Tax=Limobrevibacterium gyesilva TaxID=2991712 RepID=A0AA41YR68_9PROT|nr:flagellar basal body L-ring protein FlgH [Limobrevibacterium gyesilva]MCW3475118.1 flagellar basal body L-ring protein FlgH [Limobrevibacterium gyesilva]